MRRGWLLVLAACGAAPVPEPVDAPWTPPEEVCSAERCTVGGGIFGQWFTTDAGLPAYDYRFDQAADPRAKWFNTEHADRRDHWYATGNGRLNLLASNDGYVEVVTQDRGVTYLNKFDAARRNFGGGFSFIDDGTEVWASAYRWRPPKSLTAREFHVGSVVARTRHAGLEVARRTFAPPGDDAAVIDEVTITNHGQTARTLQHVEYWDVARRNIAINWIVSGEPIASAPGDAVAKRDALNAAFDEQVRFEGKALVLRRTRAADAPLAPAPDAPSDVDHYPGDPFLLALDADVAGLYVEQTPFFGEAGPAAPAQLAAREPGLDVSEGPKGKAGKGTGQTRMFAMRSALTLAAGASKTLRFAYGYVAQGAPVVAPAAWSSVTAADAANAVRPHLLQLSGGDPTPLPRELVWHSAQLEASAGWREYQHVHFVPQGSAYLYLHGADGAARDLGLFAVPLTYTHPALARGELTLYMLNTYAADHRFAYAFQGHGQLDDALGLHGHPSDLAIAFLWSLSEYVGATGDLQLLDEPIDFWPKGSDPTATGWTHVTAAARHLLDTVGVGPHGLVRVGTGDWSDGIVVEAADRALAIASGESVPNTQMAIAVLPRVAQLVATRDPALAMELTVRRADLCTAVKATWTGSQFGRAYFGDGVLVRGTEPDLEAAVWPLIDGCFPAATDKAVLIDRVHTKLDQPSPTGATLREGGEVWPAISALLTWGYAESNRPDLAWQHLHRNTMASHAVTFPHQWFGIWSAPDGLASTAGPRPGEAWFSPVTPMTDFPVQNNNAHAMPLLAALRVAGVTALFDGVRVAPHVPLTAWSLRTELIDVAQAPGELTGEYRKVGPGPRTLEVLPVKGTQIDRAWLDGVEVAASPAAVRFTVTARPAKFRVTLR